jgi:ATP-dependent DNA ligase
MKQEQYEKVKAEMRATCYAAGKTKGSDYTKECEVAFAEWTLDGELRQTTFSGWRDDKNPEEVVIELA